VTILKIIKFQTKPVIISIITYLSFLPKAIKKSCFFRLGFKLVNQGNLILGSDIRIFENVSVFIAKKGKLQFGSRNILNRNLVIKVANESKLETKDNVSMGNNSVILVKGSWIIGEYTNISNNCSIFSRERDISGDFKIGENSNIADDTLIDVSNDVIIGDNVAIGPGCKIYTHDHDYSDKSVPAWKGAIKHDKVIIEDDAWIGANCIIMPGIKIGKHSVVAAASLVNKNIPDNEIHGGVPSKLIKKIT